MCFIDKNDYLYLIKIILKEFENNEFASSKCLFIKISLALTLFT